MNLNTLLLKLLKDLNIDVIDFNYDMQKTLKLSEKTISSMLSGKRKKNLKANQAINLSAYFVNQFKSKNWDEADVKEKISSYCGLKLNPNKNCKLEIIFDRVFEEFAGSNNKELKPIRDTSTKEKSANHNNIEYPLKIESYIPFKKNNYFIGRDEELKSLHSYLKASSSVSITGIAGLGGIGKTQLAAEYALNFEYRKDYPDGIYWVDAAGGIYEGIYNLCSKIGIIQKGDNQDEIIKNTVRSFCLYLNKNQRSLLILDNIEHPREIFNEMHVGYSVYLLECKVIFTTRNGSKDLGKYITLNLNSLNTEKCLKLFYKESGRKIENTISANCIEYARRICEMLGFFPLAVIQACAYLRYDEDITFQGYLKRIEEKGCISTVDDSISDIDTIEHRHKFGIEAVLKLSWEKIVQKNDIFLMQTAALFPVSAGIPVFRLSLATGIPDSSETGYTSPIKKIIKVLYKWHLVEILEDGNQIRLHPLIREFIIGNINERDALLKRIESNYINAFQNVDLIVDIIKKKSVYGLLDEINSALKLLGYTSSKTLSELYMALRKNAYQIKDWPFPNQSEFVAKSYPYQYIYHSVYSTTLEQLKKGLDEYFKTVGYKGIIINERPENVLESSEICILKGHKGLVNYAEFGKDGKRVVSCSDDGTVRVWNTETGAELYVLKGHKDRVTYAEFSNDGKRVVSCSGDGTARIWDAETGAELHVLKGHEDRATYAEFSNDGKRVVSCPGDGDVIWNAETGDKLRVLQDHKGIIAYAEFSKDGKRVVSCLHDGTVRIWSAETGDELRCLKGHKSSIMYAEFSEDGKKVVSCSVDGAVRIWNAETGGKPLVLDHEDGVTYAEFSKDGKRVVSCSNGTVRVWNADTGGKPLVLKGHEAHVNYAKFSEDGKKVVSCSLDGTVRVWNADTGDELHVLEDHEDGVKYAEFSKDGKRVVSCSGDGTARIWDAETGKQIHVLIGHDVTINYVEFIKDGKKVVSCSNDGTIRIWNSETGFNIYPTSYKVCILHVAFSEDGKRVVSYSRDHAIRIWNTEIDGKPLVLEGHEGWVNHVEFSKGGKKVLSCSRNGVRIWNAETGGKPLVLDHENEVKYAEFSKDGKMVVSCSCDGTIRIWDVETDCKPLILEGYENAVMSAAFSEDGKRIVSCSYNGIVRIWDVETNGKSSVLKGHKDWVKHVEFSKDGKKVVSCSVDGTVRVWNAETGGKPLVLDHENCVELVGFSEDGKKVVSCSVDGTVRIWNAETGGKPLVLDHEVEVEYAEFSKDGKRVISCSCDGTVRIWDVETGWLEGVYHAKFYITSVKWLCEDNRMLIAGLKHNIGIPIVQSVLIK